nr:MULTISPECIES: hypothetical protein [unclassified Streptomyces]
MPAVEQRIESPNKSEFAAGTDPAFIPGLTAPVPVAAGEGAKKAPKGPEEQPEASGGPAEETAGDASPAATGAGGAAASPDAKETDALPDQDQDQVKDQDQGQAQGPDREAAEDGPVFEVSDRRGSIRVNREGVRFQLDDQEAEFDWSEIGAVEVKTSRFGRRFTVTVHLSSRRWFNAEVEAEARGRLKEWTAELDAALDAYFEED